jgi:hypothetical protein
MLYNKDDLEQKEYKKRGQASLLFVSLNTL